MVKKNLKLPLECNLDSSLYVCVCISRQTGKNSSGEEESYSGNYMGEVTSVT